MSALNSELGRLRREKANVEEKLRQLQKGVIPPETANLVDNLEKEKTEWKHKYTHLRDRYDVSLICGMHVNIYYYKQGGSLRSPPCRTRYILAHIHTCLSDKF